MYICKLEAIEHNEYRKGPMLQVYNLFSAFFRFSAPLEAVPDVAARLIAFVARAGAFSVWEAPMTLVPTTLESAVPRGEGETCLSLAGKASLSVGERLDEADLSGEEAGAVVDAETLRGVVMVVDDGMDTMGVDATVGIWPIGMVDLFSFSSSSDGVSNSAGRMRGVAWTLVISFARSQYDL